MDSRTFPPDEEEDVLTKESTFELLYEGRTKKLFQIDRPDQLVAEFKSIVNPDAKKKGKGKGSGALRNEISSYLFEYLEGFHIPTHFVKQLSDTQMLVKRLEIIPIFVRVFNVATGLLAKRFDLREGTKLSFPVIEHYLKNPDATNPWINEFHVYSFRLATPEELRLINRLASKVNAVLRALCERRDLLLASLTMEFGRHKGQILVGDELTPETCVVWDVTNKQKPQRDIFRMDRSDAEDALIELRNRLQRKS
jgi:phosphoribosylaminoimidazole-succinocarboxamide synthase